MRFSGRQRYTIFAVGLLVIYGWYRIITRGLHSPHEPYYANHEDDIIDAKFESYDSNIENNRMENKANREANDVAVGSNLGQNDVAFDSNLGKSHVEYGANFEANRGVVDSSNEREFNSNLESNDAEYDSNRADYDSSHQNYVSNIDKNNLVYNWNQSTTDFIGAAGQNIIEDLNQVMGRGETNYELTATEQSLTTNEVTSYEPTLNEYSTQTYTTSELFDEDLTTTESTKTNNTNVDSLLNLVANQSQYALNTSISNTIEMQVDEIASPYDNAYNNSKDKAFDIDNKTIEHSYGSKISSPKEQREAEKMDPILNGDVMPVGEQGGPPKSDYTNFNDSYNFPRNNGSNNVLLMEDNKHSENTSHNEWVTSSLSSMANKSEDDTVMTAEMWKSEMTEGKEEKLEATTSFYNATYNRAIAERFAMRYQQMYKNCHHTKPSPTFFTPNNNILVNEKHKLEVCVVPKAGSTAWHHFIWQLRRLDSHDDYSVKLYAPSDTTFNHKTSNLILDKTPFSNWEHGVDDDFFTEPNRQKIYRIILGRHPFARLISAWNQKMWTVAKIFERFYEWYPTMKNYRKFPPDNDHVMSWEDFATYVSDIRVHGWNMDYHFVPANELCRPCDYFFTYVVKLETMDEDRPWLEKRINVPKELAVVKTGTPGIGSKVNDNPAESIKKYMTRLAPDVVARLYKLYATDFKIFGYTFDMTTYEAGGFE